MFNFVRHDWKYILSALIKQLAQHVFIKWSLNIAKLPLGTIFWGLTLKTNINDLPFQLPQILCSYSIL